MGQVYRARHLQLGKAFALKIISPAFADDSDARARFNQEAKLASEISHPNIVSVVDFGEDAQFGAYMVMELVEGEPLVPRARADVGQARARRARQVADALDHIHKRGIIHGDVKADNIMLAAESGRHARAGVARLLDFGLARRRSPKERARVSGSPHYLASRTRRRRAGERVDAMSTRSGCSPTDAHRHASVRRQRRRDLMAHIHDPERPSKRRGEEIDEALEALIPRAMAERSDEPARSAAPRSATSSTP